MKTLSIHLSRLFMVLAALVLGSPARADFVMKWATTGDVALALDASGNVYASGGTNIRKYDGNGIFLMQWGTSGAGDGQFSDVQGIAVDGNGNVYVAEGIDRVQKFDANGTFLLKWGSSGFADGQFALPMGVAVDAAGNVYVADNGNADHNGRIQKFDGNGTFLMKWFTSAHNGCMALDANGNVFVAGGDRMFKFDPSGAALTSWGTTGCGDGQFTRISGIAADANGDVYVTEETNSRVQKFTNNGTFITKWGGLGTGDGQFIYAEGVAVDANLNVFVADLGNHRIEKFGNGVGVGGGECHVDPPPPPPPPTPTEQIATISGSVQALVARGVLLPAQGNSLMSKLDDALSLLDHKNLKSAISALEDFIKQVSTFVKTGKLTPKQGQPLIDAAQALIAELKASSASSTSSLQTASDDGPDIDASRPTTFRLLPGVCDRASGAITLRFDLPHTSDVSLKFFDVAGRAIHEAVLGTLGPGRHTWNWAPRSKGNALLLYRVQAGEFVATGKVMSVR